MMYDMSSTTDDQTVTAIGYIRVSTAGQAQDGVSLDAQRTQLTAWAVRDGLNIVIYADEGRAGRAAVGARALPPPSPPRSAGACRWSSGA